MNKTSPHIGEMPLSSKHDDPFESLPKKLRRIYLWEFPYASDMQHSMTTLIHQQRTWRYLLKASGLDHWEDTFRALMARFNGIDALVQHDDHNPHSVILNTLRLYVHNNEKPSDLAVAQHLADSVLFYYNISPLIADHSVVYQKKWNPLKEDLSQFYPQYRKTGYLDFDPSCPTKKVIDGLLSRLKSSGADHEFP